jgi:aromatic ring-opening dioxygenase catalytic subunit (LigB family)
MTIANVLYLSHGGGPMPLLGDPGHDEMVACLKTIVTQIEKPDAIIVVSAHWEASVPTITASPTPALIYDYYGFPPASYEIEYPCPGQPELAKAIHTNLINQGFSAVLDDLRGLDHGVFVPLTIMYPEADIPCVQLSMMSHLDPEQHIKLGEALRGLACENVLVIGSGFSFHNMRAFFLQATEETVRRNTDFESWLVSVMSSPSLSEAERKAELIAWSEAPSARYCHPREEHLLPLHVCYGVASSPCKQAFELTILNKKSSMYLW